MEAIDSADCSIEQIEKIYESLEENGIEVTNDLDAAAFDVPDEDLLPDDIDESPEEVEEMLLQEGVAIDDPVRIDVYKRQTVDRAVNFVFLNQQFALERSDISEQDHNSPILTINYTIPRRERQQK